MFIIEWPRGSFDWGWTDWLGLLGLLVGIAFVLTVIVALIRGEPPLEVLKYIAAPLASIFRKGTH
jgi:hypothetical protein